MSRGAVFLLLGLAAAAGGVIWYEVKKAGAGAIPATPHQGPSFIDAAKAAALAPPAPAARPASANPLGGLVSGLFGLLGAAAGGQGAHAAPTSSPTPAGAKPNPTSQSYDMGRVAAQDAATQPAINGLLDLIASGEATSAGYDTIYSGSKIAPPRPISSMTVGEVRAFQAQMIAAGSASDAVGRYQFLGGTLQDLENAGVISAGDTFDKATQDRAAVALMQRRGLTQYQSGQITAADFANNLAHEWASLPLVTGPHQGQSAYAGDKLNSANVTVPAVMKAVSSV